MKAVVSSRGKLTCEEIKEPVPGKGQVIARTLACGICGTDLHAVNHMHGFLEGLERAGTPLPVDPSLPVVFGHEFCAEIVDYGPETERRLARGTRVVGLPYVTGSRGPEYVGYSNGFPGGFGEYMVLTEKLLFPVPDHVSSTLASLTEPLAVGTHAVERMGLPPEGSIQVVLGCGPIGLAVVSALKARGFGPVVAVDFSEQRRQIAARLGADELVDPAVEPMAAMWSRLGATGRNDRRAILFECVGRPGSLQSALEHIPRRGVVIVVGNLLEPSPLDQRVAFNKELELRFSNSYSPAEFKRTLDDLARGKVDVEAMVTDTVPLAGVADAFARLLPPSAQCKIVVDLAGGTQ